jgi:hypothetical protein
MCLQQAPDCAVVPADVGQRMATTHSRGWPTIVIVVVIVFVIVANLPPRTPPSFFSFPLTAAAVHPSPPPPPPWHKVGGEAAESNFNNESTAPIHSHAPSQLQSVRGGLVESKLLKKNWLLEVLVACQKY